MPGAFAFINRLKKKLYSEAYMNLFLALLLISCILLMSGLLFIIFQESASGVVYYGLSFQTNVELAIVFIAYASGALGLITIIEAARRGSRGGATYLVAVGSIMVLFSWILLQYLYTVKRG